MGVSVYDVHVQEPYEMSGVGSPTVGSPSSVRLRICAITYMTEISLHVT